LPLDSPPLTPALSSLSLRSFLFSLWAIAYHVLRIASGADAADDLCHSTGNDAN
jgi:hypothetical protein